MGAWLALVSRVLTDASASLRGLDREAGINLRCARTLVCPSCSLFFCMHFFHVTHRHLSLCLCFAMQRSVADTGHIVRTSRG